MDEADKANPELDANFIPGIVLENLKDNGMATRTRGYEFRLHAR